MYNYSHIDILFTGKFSEFVNNLILGVDLLNAYSINDDDDDDDRSGNSNGNTSTCSRSRHQKLQVV